jgi:hypothetical protein
MERSTSLAGSKRKKSARASEAIADVEVVIPPSPLHRKPRKRARIGPVVMDEDDEDDEEAVRHPSPVVVAEVVSLDEDAAPSRESSFPPSSGLRRMSIAGPGSPMQEDRARVSPPPVETDPAAHFSPPSPINAVAGPSRRSCSEAAEPNPSPAPTVAAAIAPSPQISATISASSAFAPPPSLPPPPPPPPPASQNKFDISREKRAKYLYDWLKDLGGIHQVNNSSSNQHKEYLERVIAESNAKGIDLRLKAVVMDRRTWNSSIASLENKKLVKTKTIATVNETGTMTTTKVIYLTTITEEDLDRFVASLSKEDPGLPWKRAETRPSVVLDAFIENPPDERRTGMSSLAMEKSHNYDVEQLLAIEDDGAARAAFLTEWRAISQAYGFVIGTCARASILHGELIRLVDQVADPDLVVSKYDRVLSLRLLQTHLTLGIFVQLVSFTTYSADLHNLLSTADGKRQKLVDLPADIRNDLHLDRKETWEKLQRIVQTLCHFKLAQPLAKTSLYDDQNLSFHGVGFKIDQTLSFTHFRLASRAPVYACGADPSAPPLVVVLPVNDIDEIQHFWSQVHELSQTKQSSNPVLLPSTVSDPEFPSVCDYPHLRALIRSAGWTTTYLITPIQRGYAEHFFDSRTGASPLDDDVLFSRIAHITTVPPATLENFYETLRKKCQRKRDSSRRKQEHKAAEIAVAAERVARQKLTAKAAEQKIQLGEDWNALARRFLARKSINLTPDLTRDLQALQEQELSRPSTNHLDEAHIAIVVQELLDTPSEQRIRPQPKPKPKPAAPARQASLTTGEKVPSGKALKAASRTSTSASEDRSSRYPLPPCNPVTEDDDHLIPDCVKGDIDKSELLFFFPTHQVL